MTPAERLALAQIERAAAIERARQEGERTMMTDEQAARVRLLIALHLGRMEQGAEVEPGIYELAHPDVTDATTLASLGADSLDVVEIAMALEEDFDIEIDDRELSGCLTTVGEVVELMRKKL